MNQPEINVHCADCGWGGTMVDDGTYESDVAAVQDHGRAALRGGLDPEWCGPLVDDRI